MYEQFLIWAYGGVGVITLLGYLPQIWKLIKSTSRSEALSLSTWMIWTVTASITLLYALFITKEPLMVFHMGSNVLGCLSIIGLTTYNRYWRFMAPQLQAEILESFEASVADIVDSEMSCADPV